MKTAITTLSKKIYELDIEIRIWSSEQNFCKETLSQVANEINEHKKAIEILRKQTNIK